MTRSTFEMDGAEVPFDEGQSVMDAALAAGRYVHHLCHDPALGAHGSCRLCLVRVNGRFAASCTILACAGDRVESDTDEVLGLRRSLVQLLFTEGNHVCPACEASGACTLQAIAHDLGMTSGRFAPLLPARSVDASHPETLLDRNRCVLCELCVRASVALDHKGVFGLSGRGITKHVDVSAASGELGDTTFEATDVAASVCPVGAILPKRRGFAVPLGERRFDRGGLRDACAAAAAARGDRR